MIAIAAAYFYLSIPLIILLLLAFIAGIIYYLVIQRGLFNYLTFMIILSVLYHLFAIVRGIFFRQKQGQPGQPVTQAEQPYLWRLTQEVASRLHTAPIQVIYLAPGAEIAVFEQGTILQKLRGQGKRALLLGLGVLNGMRQGQLKSILAHGNTVIFLLFGFDGGNHHGSISKLCQQQAANDRKIVFTLTSQRMI